MPKVISLTPEQFNNLHVIRKEKLKREKQDKEEKKYLEKKNKRLGKNKKPIPSFF